MPSFMLCGMANTLDHLPPVARNNCAAIYIQSDPRAKKNDIETPK